MSAASTPDRSSGGSSWITWLIFGVAGAILLFLVVIFSIMTQGMVSGEEFSPELLQRRNFTYYQIPLVRWQVTPVATVSIKDRVIDHLTSKNLVAATTPAEPRWDFVRREPTATLSDEGNALILVHYLDDTGGSPSWEKWSDENKELAKVLWPKVIEVARDGMYVFLPDLFTAAKRAKKESELDVELARLLAEKYHAWGVTHEGLKRPDLALKFYERALKYEPTRMETKASAERLKAEGVKPPEEKPAAEKPAEPMPMAEPTTPAPAATPMPMMP